MRAVLALVVAAALSGSAGARAATLFDDLGGAAALNRIVQHATENYVADPRIADQFDNIAMPRLRRQLYNHLCQLTGGGCVYTGRAMGPSHEGLGMTDRQFNAGVEGLQDAMDQEGVPFRTQNRLLALLAPMRREMVTK